MCDIRFFIPRFLFYLAMLILLSINQAWAFYENENKSYYLNASGLVRGFINAAQAPNDPILYPDKNTYGAAGIARIMIDASTNNAWKFEFNAYQTYFPRFLSSEESSRQSPQNTGALPSSVNRSGALETNFNTKNNINFVLDRINIGWSNEDVNLILGRQAINLATTFYFSPNDFFSPFSAQTFYRVYKPGVDAARAEISLSDFSQLSIMSVLSYTPNLANADWSKTPNFDQTSHLIRWSNAFHDVETSIILGKVINKYVAGAALQGEVYEWLGIRFEGHYGKANRQTSNDEENNYQQFSLGFEHRWENSFEIRLELFYNGLGEGNVTRYPSIYTQPSEYSIVNQTPYLARKYSALGASYQLTPLLLGQAVYIQNINDSSNLFSLYATYSLSDESELVFNCILPAGKIPNNGVFKSEFGTYPINLNVEARLYF